jgi:hypothetical protein
MVDFPTVAADVSSAVEGARPAARSFTAMHTKAGICGFSKPRLASWTAAVLCRFGSRSHTKAPEETEQQLRCTAWRMLCRTPRPSVASGAFFKRFVLLLFSLTLPFISHAHRLDEYLQATLVDIQPTNIQVQINLTPGVDVAANILKNIERDDDGIISTNEAAAYAELLKRDLSVKLNRRKLNLKLTDFNFPGLSELRTGFGIIQIEFSAAIKPLTSDTHKLTFKNSHQKRISVYLFNAARPKSPSVQILNQKRNKTQSVGEIDFRFNAATL